MDQTPHTGNAERPTVRFLDIRPGDVVQTDGPAGVELVHKSGRAARLRVTADRSVRITHRHASDDPKVVPSMAT